MRNAWLALLLIATGPTLAPGATAAECYAGGRACWDERVAGSCGTYGQGWEDVKVRDAALGTPIVLHRHAWYTCAGGDHRTDTWHHNATVGDHADARTTWTAHPASDWSSLTVDVVAFKTNQTTSWYSLRGDCAVWAHGLLLGARLNDRLPCPAPPPHVPILPWTGLLP